MSAVLVPTRAGGTLSLQGQYFGDDPTVIIYFDAPNNKDYAFCGNITKINSVNSGNRGSSKYHGVEYSVVSCTMPEGQGADSVEGQVTLDFREREYLLRTYAANKPISCAPNRTEPSHANRTLGRRLSCTL